ncbi:hypothetical protein FB451DRAFT_1507960 [Mycena latifolia]|nr:hypothetical protein FB451DRAFT_1507960 [Mycena latifolia]
MGGSTVAPPASIPNIPPTDGTNPASDIATHLSALRQSLDVGAPCTSGVHRVKAQDLVVYYDVEGQNYSSRIDFGSATEQDLVALATACQHTEFQGDTRSLNGSHHRVGGMHSSQFAARLDVAASGLLDVIGPDILQGQNAGNAKSLRAELQNLQVYGPGAFVNTEKIPRDDVMVGSLVVVFPTVYVGGACTIEHTSGMTRVPEPPTPATSYFAVYGDVAQTVEPVHTGHRVALTYGLFLADGTSETPAERALAATLRALLADPTFLRAGGILASGFAHNTHPAQWDAVRARLTGTDARLCAAAERLGLAPRVKLLYTLSDGRDVLVDDIVDLDGVYEGLDEIQTAAERILEKGVVLQRGPERAAAVQAQGWGWIVYTDSKEEEDEDDEMQGARPPVPVQWLTQMAQRNLVMSPYLGSDTMVVNAYAEAGLFVQVPAVGEGIRASVI